MFNSDTVTEWISQLKSGNQQGAQKIWERYVDRLIQLANKKLSGSPKRVADEEDVVIVAFSSFLTGVEQGRFPQLNDRNDLWQLLIMLTERKAIVSHA